MRKLPNIIITGTPGVGKTSHASLLATRLPELKHLQVSRIARERGCCPDGRDERLGSDIVDEDLLLDAIEDEMRGGGCVVDWHACDLFPESWVDLVVVVRCESDVLYGRLEGRGYGEEKIGGNIDAEIMQVLLEEAREAFEEGVVVEVRSERAEEVEENVERLVEWVARWKVDNGVDGEESGEEKEASGNGKANGK